MKIIILNQEDAMKLYPLAKMLSDTGKPIGNFFGVDIFSTEELMEDNMIIFDKGDLRWK